MSEALGDFVYVNPAQLNGTIWTGRVVSRGYKVVKETTIYECNLVTYDDSDIVEQLTYDGDTVHKLWHWNINKIEGVY